MLFVGTIGVHLDVKTGWDLTNYTVESGVLEARILRPDETTHTVTLTTNDIPTATKSEGIVQVPIETPDILNQFGIYRIQVSQKAEGSLTRFTDIGTFSVSGSLPEA